MQYGRKKKERLYPYRPVCDWLLDLPPEMLIRIFKFCPRSSLVRISQCNKLCYNLVVDFLCQYFEIPWNRITARNRITCHLFNLKYAHCVVFQDSPNPFDEGPSWEEVNSNYTKILNACDEEKLVCLHLERNKMTDAVLEFTLNKFTNLDHLKLENCSQLTTLSLLMLGDLERITTLHINSCALTDSDVLKLTSLENLEDLSVILCPNITSQSLVYISRISTLRRLHYTEYGVPIPNGFECLSALSELKVLDISGCLIGNEDLIHILNRLKKLEILNVGSIIINPSELSCASRIAGLRRLGLSGCNILDDELACLQSLKSLQSLDLSWHNDISDTGLQVISKISSLRALSLKFCMKLTDDGVQLLESLRLLHTLDVSVCELLTDTCLVHIAAFPSLRVLHASECVGITDAGVEQLRSVRHDIRFEEEDFVLEDPVKLTLYD